MRNRIEDDDDDNAPRIAVDDDDLFPSFERYDAMMAAVSSRGFVGLGHDGVDAMVPLLDLLDHVRGQISSGRDSDDDRDDDSVENEGEMHRRPVSRNRTRDPGDGCRLDDASNEKFGDNDDARRPDVRYGRYEDNDGNGGADLSEERSISKRRRIGTGTDVVRSDHGGGVRVYTSRSLPMGSTLYMSYGAKGNDSLLGRYGFAIPNNVEPDGEELGAG